MNAVTKSKAELSLASNQELSEVLRNSLYPGASDGSIEMVLSYCKAAGLDPMQKPVHIVPMWDKNIRQERDVIMPGIGLYRIQAARTGQYAGVSDPVWGPDTTADLDGVEVTFPAWCKIVVRRLLPNGVIAEFAATERWTENYATARNDTRAPNSMWKRRAYAQLAKCAEAQALRKAFPEIGAQPTFEEMEGKSLDVDSASLVTDIAQATPTLPAAQPEYPTDQFNENLPKWRGIIESGKSTPERIIAMVQSKGVLSEEQKQVIYDLMPPNVGATTVENTQ